MEQKKFSYIDPFVIAAIDVINKMTGSKAVKKNIEARRGKKSKGGVGIILDIMGDITGKVSYEFSREITMRLSSALLKESQIFTSSKEEYKQLLESALLELANIISGNAMLYFEKRGLNCNITPPRFYLGKGVELSPFYLMTIAVDFTTIYGDFSINLSLNQKRIA